MKYFSSIILLLFLFLATACESEKPDPSPQPDPGTGTGTSIKIDEMRLAVSKKLLYSTSPVVVAAPGESADISIKEASNSTTDAVASNLTYTSSDPAVATFSNGKVTALKAGDCTVTAKHTDGTETSIKVVVQTDNLPSKEEAFSASFPKAIILQNIDKAPTIVPSIVNRLGQPVKGDIKLVFAKKDKVTEFSPGAPITLEEGFYRLTAKSGERELLGAATVGLYKSLSNLSIPESPAPGDPLGGSAPPPGSPGGGSASGSTPLEVLHISLDWGISPQLFTKPGAVAKPITGLKFIGTRKQDSQGKFIVEIMTTLDEEVTVEAEAGGVISGTSIITALKPGRGRFRPVEGSYTGTWYSCYVAFDFSGEWTCKSNGRGMQINMNIPVLAEDVVYSKSNYGDIARNYEAGRSAGYLYQKNLGQAEFIDATTKTFKYEAKVEIGPSTMHRIAWLESKVHDEIFSNIGLIAYQGTPGYGFLHIVDSKTIRVQDTDNHSYTFTKGAGTPPFVGKLGSISYQGRNYETIQLGTQTWFAENLQTTTYRDGSPISLGLGQGYSSKTDGYGYPGNDSKNKETYGLLYNWYAVMNPKGICPAGWRVPTELDWHDLVWQTNYYVGAVEQTLKARRLWETAPVALTNASKFSILPAGEALPSDGDTNETWYRGLGSIASFWTTREYLIPGLDMDTGGAYYWHMWDNTIKFEQAVGEKRRGYSCRCIKE